MLLLPNKKIRGPQIVIILIVMTTISITSFIAWLALLPDAPFLPPDVVAEYTEDRMVTRSFLFDFFIMFSQLTFPLFFFISLIIIFNFLLLWTPSFVTIPVDETMKRKGWSQTLLRRDIRFSIKGNLVVIRRKRSSLKGILLREMVFEIHISKSQSDHNRINDFLSYEKSVVTPTHIILIKTVKTQHLPLQVIKIRALLALITDPINVYSYRESVN